MRLFPRSRKVPALVTVTAVASGALAVAAPAQAPPITLDVNAKVSPNKAGSKRKPRGVKISVDARIGMPDGYDPPLVQKVEVLFPKGGVYNGDDYAKCSETTLARRGLDGCSKKAIMGKGKGYATADTVPTYPKITVVNGGKNRVYFYTVMTNPARVQAPVPGVITKLRSSKWSYRLVATIPRSLQIVAGVPIKLNRLKVSAGKGKWLATTSCPRDRKWDYHVKVSFSTGETVEYEDYVRCRR